MIVRVNPKLVSELRILQEETDLFLEEVGETFAAGAKPTNNQ